MLTLLAGCDGGSPVPKCTPGQSVACTGSGPCSGYQVCRPDGTFADCVCGDAGSGAAGADASDSGADADASDSRADADGPRACVDTDAAAPNPFPAEKQTLVTAICDRQQRCGRLGGDAGALFASYEVCLEKEGTVVGADWTPAEVCRDCPGGAIDPARLSNFCLSDIKTLPCTNVFGGDPLTMFWALDCGLRTLCKGVGP